MLHSLKELKSRFFLALLLVSLYIESKSSKKTAVQTSAATTQATEKSTTEATTADKSGETSAAKSVKESKGGVDYSSAKAPDESTSAGEYVKVDGPIANPNESAQLVGPMEEHESSVDSPAKESGSIGESDKGPGYTEPATTTAYVPTTEFSDPEHGPGVVLSLIHI